MKDLKDEDIFELYVKHIINQPIVDESVLDLTILLTSPKVGECVFVPLIEDISYDKGFEEVNLEEVRVEHEGFQIVKGINAKQIDVTIGGISYVEGQSQI